MVLRQKDFLYKHQLQQLLSTLKDQGYRVIGPQIKEGAIIYAEVNEVAQMPFNIRQSQKPGHYELQSEENNYHFAWANGPQALKPLTFSPKETLWRSITDETGHIEFTETSPEQQATAVIGVRACDLAGLALQDKHFLQTEFQDSYFNKRRENLLLIAVNCTHPAETCFCASTGDGPQATSGYDLAMTELKDGFVIHAQSAPGKDILQKLQTTIAGKKHHEQETSLLNDAIKKQSRKLPQANLKTVLPEQVNSDYWSEVAQRCLSCGNCTSVCPTCFCHSEGEECSIDGTESLHYRQWDSCFNHDHSYIHGIIIRTEAASKYRQWLTHKFANWYHQYDRSGCVGCGRCISWCPVGIDVTEELHKVVDRSQTNE